MNFEHHKRSYRLKHYLWRVLYTTMVIYIAILPIVNYHIQMLPAEDQVDVSLRVDTLEVAQNQLHHHRLDRSVLGGCWLLLTFALCIYRF